MVEENINRRIVEIQSNDNEDYTLSAEELQKVYYKASLETLGEEVKQKPHNLLNLLTTIANLSITLQDLPNSQKKTLVTVIPKKGTRITNLKNIRPISVSPLLSKLISGILASRLGRLLVEHDVLDRPIWPSPRGRYTRTP